MSGTIGINQGTSLGVAADSVGGTYYGIGKIDISPAGFAGTLFNGTVGISQLPNLPGGSIAVIAGTIASDTVVGGTLNLVTTVSNLSAGSVNVTAGTIATLGTMGTLGSALGVGVVTTVTNLSNGTIQNSGTVTGVGSVSSLGSLAMLTAGTVSMINAGTITSVGTIPGIGVVTSITNLAGGTINAGTLRSDARTTQNILSYGTQFSGTAAIAGTIIGSSSVGSGTSLWLQDISVTNNNANVLCVLGFGTAQQGTNILLRATLGTAGAIGIEKSFGKLVNCGMTNQDLVMSLGAAGTIDVTFSYLISA